MTCHIFMTCKFMIPLLLHLLNSTQCPPKNNKQQVFNNPGEMRGETAPYSLVPSEESSLLHEREGEAEGEALSIKTGPTDKKRR